MEVSHVIFDVDGLLLNTEDLYTIAMSNVAHKFGKCFTPEIKIKQMGTPTAVSSRIFIDELDLPITIDELTDLLKVEYERLFPGAKLLPGAENLVRRLCENNVPICLASGSNATYFKIKSSKHVDFFAQFEHAVLSGSDPEVTHGKPHPDIFLIAARRFKTPPNDFAKVLVFEDAPNGVKAALAAGMPCVWVPSVPEVDTRQFGEDRRDLTILKSLEQFDFDAVRFIV